jgi:Uma2 family endonuclease
MSTVTPAQTEEIDYPSSDGAPMGETELHVNAILELRETLRAFFQDRRDVYVAANMFWYWQEGDPKARRAPDVMVVFGVDYQTRRSFFSWHENGARPAVIFEVSSYSTWREDLYDKRRLYAELGVKEYFLFDPEGVILRPPLQGFRLHQDHYEPLEADGADRLFSEELNLFLFADGSLLRLVEPGKREPLLTPAERAEKARQELEQERLRADRENLRADQEQLRADRADLRAEQEALRAEKERLRADTLEMEIARLRAQIQDSPPSE